MGGATCGLVGGVRVPGRCESVRQALRVWAAGVPDARLGLQGEGRERQLRGKPRLGAHPFMSVRPSTKLRQKGHFRPASACSIGPGERTGKGVRACLVLALAGSKVAGGRGLPLPSGTAATPDQRRTLNTICARIVLQHLQYRGMEQACQATRDHTAHTLGRRPSAMAAAAAATPLPPIAGQLALGSSPSSLTLGIFRARRAAALSPPSLRRLRRCGRPQTPLAAGPDQTGCSNCHPTPWQRPTPT